DERVHPLVQGGRGQAQGHGRLADAALQGTHTHDEHPRSLPTRAGSSVPRRAVTCRGHPHPAPGGTPMTQLTHDLVLEVLEGCTASALAEARELGAVRTVSATELMLRTDDLDAARCLRRVVAAS